MNKSEFEKNVGSNHESHMNNDRHAQNRLLDIDEQLGLTDYMVEIKGYTDIKVPKTIKVTKNDEILGWFSSSKCILRKPEKEKQNSQPVNSYSWREQTRLKNLIQDSFTFKHYPYSKSYIEQYREENSMVTGLKSPIARETNEPKKVGLQNASSTTPTQAYNSGQNMCNHCNQPTNPQSQNLITAAFNYTRRESTSVGNGTCKCNQNQIQSGHHGHSSHTCSKHNHHHHKDAASQAYKYKLTRDHAMMPNVAWKSEPELIEIDKDTKTPRVLSGKRSAGKTPTKVTVPSLPNGHSKNIQTVTVQQLSQGRPGSGGANTTPSQNLRALDALTCIASEKQRKTRPYSTVQVRALGHILMDTIKGVGIKRPDAGMMISAMDFSRSKSEMWFDTTGRAYVSLAARYEPLKK